MSICANSNYFWNNSFFVGSLNEECGIIINDLTTSAVRSSLRCGTPQPKKLSRCLVTTLIHAHQPAIISGCHSNSGSKTRIQLRHIFDFSQVNSETLTWYENWFHDVFLSDRYWWRSFCTGFNWHRWVSFSEFAGRRSFLDPCQILWWLTMRICSKPVAGHARRGNELTG